MLLFRKENDLNFMFSGEKIRIIKKLRSEEDSYGCYKTKIIQNVCSFSKD